MVNTPHSAAVLTDLRDRWWSEDFLELLAARLGLHDCERVVDVGSGHGDWGQRLLRHLAPHATLDGVDREVSWVERATERATELGLAPRCQYRVGAAEQLPFADGAFDLVTCQTVLMHLKDVR